MLPRCWRLKITNSGSVTSDFFLRLLPLVLGPDLGLPDGKRIQMTTNAGKMPSHSRPRQPMRS